MHKMPMIDGENSNDFENKTPLCGNKVERGK